MRMWITNCAADRGLAVTVFASCLLIVLCCRCACVCINVRVVIYGISRQRGHYRVDPRHPDQPPGNNRDRLSEEEDPAAPPLHQQEEHVGETQVTIKEPVRFDVGHGDSSDYWIIWSLVLDWNDFSLHWFEILFTLRNTRQFGSNVLFSINSSQLVKTQVYAWVHPKG